MKETNQIIITLVCIGVTSICIALGETTRLEIPRIVFGTVTLLFIPGRRLTKVFFDKKEIDMLERVALSFALSIAVVPLLVFYLNLAGVPISAWLVVGVVSAIVAGSYGYMKFFNTKKLSAVGN